MKLIFPLLGLGTTVGGVFIGSIQQNVFRPGKPYIDVLFEEIEKDIRKFSRENPLTATVANEIKTGNSPSSSDSRRKRSVETSEEAKESKNTLGVWTDIWIQLLSNYIYKLWIGNTTNIDASTTLNEKVRHFSEQEKQEAIKYSDKQNEVEKKRFEQKLSGKETKIKDIYKRMKEFVLQIEFPENYKYNRSDSDDCPYENYIIQISK